MRRYMMNFSTKNMIKLRTDCLVIGSGVAGLQAARIVDPTIVRTIAMGIASHRPASDAVRHIARLARTHIIEAFKTMGMPEHSASNG